MSYLQTLLDQDEPLEPHEVSDLRAWLQTLRNDVEMFGPTAEDVARMRRISAKIKENDR